MCGANCAKGKGRLRSEGGRQVVQQGGSRSCNKGGGRSCSEGGSKSCSKGGGGRSRSEGRGRLCNNKAAEGQFSRGAVLEELQPAHGMHRLRHGNATPA